MRSNEAAVVPHSAEAGFTLIELLMALTVMVIAIVPMTTLLSSGLRTSAASAHRDDAFSLATKETEALHAVPYSLLGFYTDQSPPPWQANTTVILGACSTTCGAPITPLVVPAGTSTPAPSTGITYTIARYIYWTDAQGVNNAQVSTTFLQAYKGTTVVVSWSDQAGSHSVEQDSIIYPGGQGLYSGGGSPNTTTTVAGAVPVAPALAVAAVQPVWPASENEIDLAITAPLTGTVTYYQLQWSTTSSFTSPAQSPQLPGTSISYPVQGLTPNTLYYFRLLAANGAGQSPYSAVVSAATASTVAPAQPCTLGNFSITTSTAGKTYLDNKGAMSEDIGLNLSVNSPCSSVVTVTSVLHGTPTADSGSPYVLSGPAAGGQWSATVFSSGQRSWSVGLHDLTVLVGATGSGVSGGLLICAWTPPGQRSSSANAC